MKLFEEVYDGELSFDIENEVISEDSVTMDIKAEHEGKEVGFQVVFPIMARKLLFKKMIMPDTTRPIQFHSLGVCSDAFVRVLDKLWNPDFEVEGKFDENPVEFEYAILNKELFDCLKDKTYTRIYAEYKMEEETGDPYDNIAMELGFNFNLSRKRASIVEMKRKMRNDFLVLISE